MHHVFTLLIAFFIVACIYEGVKIFNEDNYGHYPFKLSHALLTPLFAVVAYTSVLTISKMVIPVNFSSGIFILCAMIPAIGRKFCHIGNHL